MNRPLFALALPLFALLALPAPARADLPPPDTYSCTGKAIGDSCDLDQTSPAQDAGGRLGACAKATCTKADYANWDHDASASPPSVMYDCLKCMAPSDGGTDATASGADSAAAGGGAGTGGSSGMGGSDGGAGTGGSKSDSSGCALGALHPRALGPWALALVFGALVLFGRRRR